MRRTAKTTHAAKLVSRAGSTGPAFTLVEVLVAVGAVAIIAVGLASIFSSVSKTVSGGRRVSLLNQYAGLIENRMRRDFEHMTRDGVLVIRQQYTDGTRSGANPDGVADVFGTPIQPSPDAARLSPEQRYADARPRRIDEIVFFVRDDATTKRLALSPEAIARSKEARVYYGNGMRMANPGDPETMTDSEYLYPLTESRNDVGIFVPGPLLDAPLGKDVDDNPNRFAADWTLLRHVTLLVNPETAEAPRFSVPVYGLSPGVPAQKRRLANGEFQIDLQPAAESIFRAMCRKQIFDPVTIYRGPQPLDVIRPSGQTPNVLGETVLFASGLVDIATTDLAEVRAVVNGMGVLPSGAIRRWPSAWFFQGNPNAQYAAPAPLGGFSVSANAARAANPATADSLDLMHDWMAQLFPTESNPIPDAMFLVGNQESIDPAGCRMRYETTAPGLLSNYVIKADLPGAETSTQALARAIRHADQLQLEASNFVPHCSEFIVEWSFGEVRPNTDPGAPNQTIWYGLERYADPDKDGLIARGERPIVRPYGADTSIPWLNKDVHIRGRWPNPDTTQIWNFTDRLIYGYRPLQNQACLTSYFGYVDPRYQSDNNSNGIVDAGDAVEREMPWPWPKMIRVTVTLSDPVDPSIESSFQFVFNVPDDPGT